MRQEFEQERPAYIRLGRAGVPVIYSEDAPLEIGKGAQLKDGDDVAIIATGILVADALKAAETLEAEGISARVIDMHTIKPLDNELVLKAAKETGCIVTTEEANVMGGLGAAVAELLAEEYPVPVVRHGVNDEFGRSGTAAAVLEHYGITAEGLCAKIREALAKK
jgi:transketolase